LQASTSLGLIGREAPAIAISLAHSFLKPPPVPELATVTRAGFSFWNSSATASLIGNTVLDPSIEMGATAFVATACEADWGLSSFGCSRCLEQAGRPSAAMMLRVAVDRANASWLCTDPPLSELMPD
jgi:hypothetical protein